ncbi:MAG: DUF3153 domain-containing protein [Acidimicrobiia bacterium]
MTRRLLFSYLTITVFTLLVLEIPLGVLVSSLQRERLASDLQRDAMVLATLYEDALDNAQPYSPEPAMRYAEATGGRVIVVDGEGRSIVDTAGPANRDFSTRPEVQRALAGVNERPDTRFSDTLGREILFAAVPVASGGVVHGAVRITFDPGEVNDLVRSYWWGLLGIGLVVLTAVAAVGWIIARSVARPLIAMGEAARAAGSGDLSVRIDAGEAPDEVRELAGAFNTMSSRLESLIERQRSFVADASHELRTPLTALRLRLENLEESVDEDARPDLLAALAESERLAELVEQLLTIARTEGGAKPVHPVDLAAVVVERCDLWTAVAEEQGVNLVADVVGEVVVQSVAGGVEQIVDNLVSNALAVTPQGRSVVVSVSADGSLGTLRVRDEGPGMKPEDRDRAFDRFWRGDHSKPGSGLGLAIVRDLAESSGGSAGLEATAEGGIEAVAAFPRWAGR